MSKLSHTISGILGFSIKEGEWQKYLADLDREGEPTRRHIGEILFALAADQEELRKELDSVLLKEQYDLKKPKGRNAD